MAISFNKVGAVVTTSITTTITGMGLGGLTLQQQKERIMEDCIQQLASAIRLNVKADADIDAEYAAKVALVNAERDLIKASRPSGSI